MTLTKPFGLPCPEKNNSQKSSKSTSFAAASLTVNPTTDSFRDRTAKQSIISDAQTLIVGGVETRPTTTKSSQIDPLSQVLNKLSRELNTGRRRVTITSLATVV